MLRETFAVRYLQAGSNPLVLQELLGRADLATVKRYQHLSKQVREKQTRKKS
jgi:site-specific recombinase XerD